MVDKEIVLSKEEIADRVRQLGQSIARDFAGRKLVLVGVLNGAFIFLADLARQIDIPLEVDFVRVASYGNSTSSSGTVNFSKDIELDVEGKDVILVEDIVDTGRTIAALKDFFAAKRANVVKICTLIDKHERREVAVQVDYVGFEVEQGFLVGYGLDYAEQHRHYPAVYHLKTD